MKKNEDPRKRSIYLNLDACGIIDTEKAKNILDRLKLKTDGGYDYRRDPLNETTTSLLVVDADVIMPCDSATEILEIIEKINGKSGYVICDRSHMSQKERRLIKNKAEKMLQEAKP
jgi:hypothetical protein